jgi:hypothetical protein
MRKLIRPCDLLRISDNEGTIARVRTLKTERNEEEKQRNIRRRRRRKRRKGGRKKERKIAKKRK